MFAWIDLETTGLNAQVDIPIEIAGVVTDNNLEIKGEFSALIPWQKVTLDALLDAGDGFTRRMHTANGLVDALAALFSGWGPGALAQERLDVENDAIEFFREWTDYFGLRESDRIHLGGNAIDFDVKFLHRYMPRLADMFHHRLINVSTLSVLAKTWAPAVYESRPVLEGTAHRALDDIRHSIATVRYYRNVGFLGVARFGIGPDSFTERVFARYR